jgi:FAD/FMN-containing dehydrogenase
VGISGHALHGGFGFASHWKGLTLDWLSGAQIILADGKVYQTSPSQNKDLFWAIQGGGSAMGVVTELRFKTFAAPSNGTVFTINLNWNNEQAARNGLTAFRNFARDNMPSELNMRLQGNAQGATLEGVYYGSTQQFNNVINPLLKSASGTVKSAKTQAWMDAFKSWANNEKIDATYPYSMVSAVALDSSFSRDHC